jgi:hypothetical protein
VWLGSHLGDLVLGYERLPGVSGMSGKMKRKSLIAVALVVCATIVVVAVMIVRHVNTKQNAAWCYDHEGQFQKARPVGSGRRHGGKLQRNRDAQAGIQRIAVALGFRAFLLRSRGMSSGWPTRTPRVRLLPLRRRLTAGEHMLKALRAGGLAKS